MDNNEKVFNEEPLNNSALDYESNNEDTKAEQSSTIETKTEEIVTPSQPDADEQPTIQSADVKSKKKNKDNSLAIKRQIDLIDQKIKNTYEDKLNNIISTELYIQISTDLEKKKNELNIRLNDLNKLGDNNKEEIREESIEKYIKKVLEFNSDSEIDREIILKLINKIVLENKKIKSISYNFSI